MESEAKKEGTAKSGPEKKGRLGRQGRQVIALFAVLILVLAAFIVSYNLFKSSSSFKYGDFKVYKTRQGTTVDFYFIPVKTSSKNSFSIMMRNDPRKIENIMMNSSSIMWGSITKVIVTTNENYTSDAAIASGEIGRFSSGIGLNTSYALTSPLGDYPAITCQNATKATRVIDLRLGNQTRVYGEGYCIVAEGEDYPSMIKAAERLMIGWLNRLYIIT